MHRETTQIEQMEVERATESEAIFESLGLNPRLFLSDVLNVVDDLTDGAFDYFLRKAPEVVIGSLGDKKAEALEKGCKSVQKLVNAAKEEGFGCWEMQCLKQAFVAPPGFTLSEYNDSSKCLSTDVELSDTELDIELDSLRKKITAAGKEHEDLCAEITLLEKGSNFRTKFDTSVAETVGVYEDNSVQESFRDILKEIPKLHQKLLGMKSTSSTSVQHLLISSSYDDMDPAFDTDFPGSLEDVRDVIDILKAKEAY